MHSRRLLITHCVNVRELGGFPTLDGKTTKWQQLIRGEMPVALASEDIQFLKNYGVRTIIDLRWANQIKLFPSSLTNSKEFRVVNLPIYEKVGEIESEKYHPAIHLPIIMKHSTYIAAILRVILETDGATFFHCRWGKDRTGVVAAILLLLANVPEADIVSDYAVSYTYLRPIIAPYESKYSEGWYMTKPEWFYPLLDFIKSYGGVRSYLVDQGLTEDEIDSLRNKLVE